MPHLHLQKTLMRNREFQRPLYEVSDWTEKWSCQTDALTSESFSRHGLATTFLYLKELSFSSLDSTSNQSGKTALVALKSLFSLITGNCYCKSLNMECPGGQDNSSQRDQENSGSCLLESRSCVKILSDVKTKTFSKLFKKTAFTSTLILNVFR